MRLISPKHAEAPKADVTRSTRAADERLHQGDATLVPFYARAAAANQSRPGLI